MDQNLYAQLISVIRNEEERRGQQQESDELWRIADIPVLNELCLGVLVSLNHRIEREIGWFCSRLPTRRGKKRKDGYGALDIKPEMRRQLELLRLLVNSFKHDRSAKINQNLLDALGCDKNVKYDIITDSDVICEKLSEKLGLGTKANYCDITECFVVTTCALLTDIESKLPPVEQRLISLDPDTFLH